MQYAWDCCVVIWHCDGGFAFAAAKKFGRSFLREASFEKKKAIVEEFFQVDYVEWMRS